MHSDTTFIRIRSAAGAIVLLSGLPAVAQKPPAAAASAASASPTPNQPSVITPSDPTLFVILAAAVVLVGYVAVKARGRRATAR